MSRSTWTIPSTRWHARAYRKWKVLAYFKRPSLGYQENLCHYWRVVLFWSHWTRFICWFVERKTVDDPYNREDKIPPILPSCFALIVGLYAFALYSSYDWPLATGLFFGIPLTIAILVFAGFTAYGKYEDGKYGDASPNLIFERVRAKKHKICPLIEVEDPESTVV